MKKFPGIFNDVIGPVMRGPSSSHTAASWRIARIGLDLLGEPLKKATIAFDSKGAWAPNFREQGTVMGIHGGLLGLEITDDGMKDPESIAKDKGISISYEISSFPTRHPNTVRLNLEGSFGRTVLLMAESLGGGSFEIVKIDEFEVQIQGDYHELIIKREGLASQAGEIRALFPNESIISVSNGKSNQLLTVKSSNKFQSQLIEKIESLPGIIAISSITPVLPVVSGNSSYPPFNDIKSLLEYANQQKLDAGQLGMIYEKCRSAFSDMDLKYRMDELIKIIHRSIQTGISGTSFTDRILHQQSNRIFDAEMKGRIPKQPLINQIITNVTAIMESKSAMEVVVANPTAGSCGTIGGVLKAVSDEVEASADKVNQAYFAAGLIGAFFAMGPGFSAEEHGCQVECGAASGMAAAGIVQLYGGSAKQAVDAASMAIQNMIGLVCDPVADRVEVPCLGKNISAAVNALSSATMACAGYDAVIPLDEVIKTVAVVSKQMPVCVKCTGKGGLAITPTAMALKNELKNL